MPGAARERSKSLEQPFTTEPWPWFDFDSWPTSKSYTTAAVAIVGRKEKGVKELQDSGICGAGTRVDRRRRLRLLGLTLGGVGG